jgi:chorismate mutase
MLDGRRKIRIESLRLQLEKIETKLAPLLAKRAELEVELTALLHPDTNDDE